LTGPSSLGNQPNQHCVYTREVCEVAASCANQASTKAGRRIPLAEVLVVEVAAGVWLEATEARQLEAFALALVSGVRDQLELPL
jgi:hypothetical protein